MKNFAGSDAEFTTAGELRKLLEGVGNDTPVTISQISTGVKVAGLCVLSTIGDKSQRPEMVDASARHLVSAICICEVSE